MLLTARPLTGHMQPLLPLAAAAGQRGHEVAFATGMPVVSELRERGLKCFAAGRGREARIEFDPRARELEALEPEERRVAFFAELFVGIELEPRLDDLVDVIERWRPDVLLHDAAELAGPIAATMAGIPYVTVGFGARLSDRVLEHGAATAEPHWRARGLEPPAHAGLYRHLYVDPFPPSLQLPGVAQIDRQAARLTPLVATDAELAPEWLATLPRQPTVYVSLGTIWNRKVDVFRAVLDAVDGLAVNMVVTLGANGDPAALGPQPANIQVHRFVPQAHVLPVCAAVVCHGGSGTMLGGIAHGLPQLLLPQGADQFANAELLAATGAGRTLLAHETQPAQIRSGVVELLENAELRAAAGRLRDELDAMPLPDVAIERIEALCA
jgi:UDP:flavonoid glycosyltransferase YjiC (YdhE family)